MGQFHLMGVVGPCASGKSTLVSKLQALNMPAKNIAQEHSYVPEMWHILTNPDFLIYLDVSYEVATQRRNLNWTEDEYERQLLRLTHARNHADIIILTDKMTIDEVLQAVLLQMNLHT